MHFARSERHSLSPGSCIPRLAFARRTPPGQADGGLGSLDAAGATIGDHRTVSVSHVHSVQRW
jgi:hypothetical protein